MSEDVIEEIRRRRKEAEAAIAKHEDIKRQLEEKQRQLDEGRVQPVRLATGQLASLSSAVEGRSTPILRAELDDDGEPILTDKLCGVKLASRTTRRTGQVFCSKAVPKGLPMCQWHYDHQMREAQKEAAERARPLINTGVGGAADANPSSNYDTSLKLRGDGSPAIKYGQKRTGVSPINALLMLIYEAHGNVEYLRREINKTEKLVISGKKEREEITGLVRLYNEERDRLEGYIKDALRIGLEQRQLKLYEIQAQGIASIVNRILEALSLTPQQRALALSEAGKGIRAFVQSANMDPWRGPLQDAAGDVVDVPSSRNGVSNPGALDAKYANVRRIGS